VCVQPAKCSNRSDGWIFVNLNLSFCINCLPDNSYLYYFRYLEIIENVQNITWHTWLDATEGRPLGCLLDVKVLGLLCSRVLLSLLANFAALSPCSSSRFGIILPPPFITTVLRIIQCMYLVQFLYWKFWSSLCKICSLRSVIQWNEIRARQTKNPKNHRSHN
jgi:hypothetical protein